MHTHAQQDKAMGEKTAMNNVALEQNWHWWTDSPSGRGCESLQCEFCWFFQSPALERAKEALVSKTNYFRFITLWAPQTTLPAQERHLQGPLWVSGLAPAGREVGFIFQHIPDGGRAPWESRARLPWAKSSSLGSRTCQCADVAPGPWLAVGCNRLSSVLYFYFFKLIFIHFMCLKGCRERQRSPTC